MLTFIMRLLLQNKNIGALYTLLYIPNTDMTYNVFGVYLSTVPVLHNLWQTVRQRLRLHARCSAVSRAPQGTVVSR